MLVFEKLSDDRSQTWRSLAHDPQHGRSGIDRIVMFASKHWYVKCKPEQPAERCHDCLAFGVAKMWANIAEVRLLSKGEFSDLRDLLQTLGEHASEQNTYLVRFAADYAKADLVLKNLDEAAAAELVFSLWIRRRDANPFNRVYVDGIPVFFDHGTAILDAGAHGLLKAAAFFEEHGDVGRAGSWRLLVSENGPDTIGIREQAQKTGKAWHPIRSEVTFWKCVQNAVERIQKMSINEWEETAGLAQYCKDDVARVVCFLRATQHKLAEDVELMRSVLLARDVVQLRGE